MNLGDTGVSQIQLTDELEVWENLSDVFAVLYSKRSASEAENLKVWNAFENLVQQSGVEWLSDSMGVLGQLSSILLVVREGLRQEFEHVLSGGLIILGNYCELFQRSELWKDCHKPVMIWL